MARPHPDAPDPRISVVVPCFNEQGNPHRVVERVRLAEQALGFPVEIVFVDDASTDATPRELSALAADGQRVVVSTHASNRGIAAAWTTGVRGAHGEWVVLCDADLQYDPADVAKLWQRLQRDDCEVVQGRRVFAADSCSPLRLALSVGFSWLLNASFGVALRDVKSDFLIAPRRRLREVLGDAKKFCFFQHYIAVAFLKRRVVLRQIPVAFGKRNAGRSFIGHPFRFSAAALAELPSAVRFYRSLARDTARATLRQAS